MTPAVVERARERSLLASELADAWPVLSAEDDAGGLMNPRYARLRPDMSVDEAITYLRRQARERLETIYYMYVLDSEQRLLGVVSFRDLFAALPEKKVRDIMHTEVVTAPESMD